MSATSLLFPPLTPRPQVESLHSISDVPRLDEQPSFSTDSTSMLLIHFYVLILLNFKFLLIHIRINSLVQIYADLWQRITPLQFNWKLEIIQEWLDK